MKTLLIVEDDPNLRLLYEEEFREEGYHVLTAASGEEALEIARRSKVAGVVLDIRLGGMDGLEVMRRLLDVSPDTVVVLNSAYPSFKSNFASWGAERYVVKSSNLRELKQAVHDALFRLAA
jgi:DNA-binding response OmpR family regulator